MRAPPGSRTSRATFYALIGSAFLLVGAYTATLTMRLREKQQAEAVDRAASDLSALVGVWESSVLERSASWLTELAEAPDPDRREARIRGGASAVDAVYVWSPRLPVPTLIYPRTPNTHDPEAGLAMSRALDEAEAELLADHPDLAWSSLSRISSPLFAALSDDRPEAPPLDVLLRRRLLAMRVLAVTGDHSRQESLLTRTLSELATLPTPALGPALPWLQYPLLNDLLASDGGDPLGLEAHLAAARRRAAALEQLEARLPRMTALVAEDGSDRPVAPSASVSPERPLSAGDLRVDADGADRGYLLIYALSAERALGVAVQWSVPDLLDDMVRAVPVDPNQGEPVILDADGRVLRGARACADGTPGDGRAVWASAAFTRLLPHLKVGLCALPDRPPPHAGLRGLPTQLAPLIGALGLGLLAVLARASADRHQRELYERQYDFVTRVTHELKTPLAGIRIMAENLEIGAFKDAAQRELLAGRIVGEVDRLGERIDEVLRVARTEGTASREPLAVEDLADEVASPWRDRFASRGAVLELDLQRCPPVNGDRALLRDAINNLLDNALKYLRDDRPGQVRLSTRPEGRWVVVEVIDNGLGVPAARRKAIFEPFVRVEGPGRGKAGGHGLGLAFVAETARVHGGTVECREGVSGGARFVLRLRRGRWKRDGSPASSSSRTTTPSRSGS